MVNIFVKILLLILTSCFLFPFEFTFLPGVNVKMIMAILGLAVLSLRILDSKNIEINKNLFFIFLIALLFSLYVYIVIVYNNTPDTTYVTYIISMSVWLSSAYFLIVLLKHFYGYISVELVSNYFIGVSVAQCVLSVIIYEIPAVKHIVNTYIAASAFVDTYDRLYGIGCFLDTAGNRFSCVLVMIAVITNRFLYKSEQKRNLVKYIFAFMIISVIGSIISRTTTVGIVLAIIYTIFGMLKFYSIISFKSIKFYSTILAFLIITVGISTYLYNTNRDAREFLRFGFEGFFSLAEKGEWDVNSNNELKAMYKWPDNTKTWLIGDGYILQYDSYGNIKSMLMYAESDVGYVKFIFYFGLIGLFIFSLFFVFVTKACIAYFPRFKIMFMLFLLINFIIWTKVSTDVLVIFAPFLVFSSEDSDYREEMFNTEEIDTEYIE